MFWALTSEIGKRQVVVTIRKRNGSTFTGIFETEGRARSQICCDPMSRAGKALQALRHEKTWCDLALMQTL